MPNNNPATPTAFTRDFLDAIEDDLQSLAVLHDREPSKALVSVMRDVSFPNNLGLRINSKTAQNARTLFANFFATLGADIDDQIIERLSVDYADIYLNFSCRASPTESPWTDEDGLDRQSSMFAVRKFYRNRGLAVQNWAKRSDDHVVHQLQFLAHLFKTGHVEALREAGEFLDAHPLCWIEQFATQVVNHSHSSYFSGVALITSAYLTALRQLLGDAVSIPVNDHTPKKSDCTIGCNGQG